MKWSVEYRWALLGVLWLTALFLHGTRQVFAATLPSVKADFLAGGVTDAKLGAVFTVFFAVYAICLPFSGIAADLLRRKWIVITGVFVFSTGTILASYAGGLSLFVLAYGVLVAIGQCFIGASATSLISQYHVKTRATAFSVYQSALYIGVILFSALSGWLCGLGDGAWRIPFRLFGCGGLALGVVLVFVLDDRHPSSVMRAAAKERCFKDAALVLFRRPSAMLISVSLVAFCYVGGAYNAWMPTHLKDLFPGLSIASAAFHAVAWHFLGALLGVSFGSRLSDRVAAARPGIRVEMLLLGLLCGMPLIVLTAYAPAFTLCCLATALLGFFRGVYDSNLFAALFSVIPVKYHAAGAAISFSFAFLLGSTSTIVLGWMRENLSFRLGFSSLAIFYLVGAAALFVARVCFLDADRERAEG